MGWGKNEYQKEKQNAQFKCYTVNILPTSFITFQDIC